MTGPLQHWDGSDAEFWDAVHNPAATQEAGDPHPSSHSILVEVLRLAGERAEQIHRTRSMVAKGYKAPMTLFQLQMGVEQEDHDAKQRQHAERCRAEIAESRYVPRKLREPHGRCPGCDEVLKYPDQDCSAHD